MGDKNAKPHVKLRNNKIVENIFYLLILQGMNYILPWITMPYLVRILGPDNFGQLSFAQSLNQYFIFVTDYGFNLSATREIALNRDNPAKVASIFFSISLIRIVLAAACFLCLIILILSSKKIASSKSLMFLSFMTVIGSAIFPIWLYQGLEVMRNISVINIFTKATATILIFLLVKTQDDLLLAAGLQSVGFLFAGILGFLGAFRYVKRQVNLWDSKLILDQLKEGWHIFASMAAVSLYTNTNQVILGYVSNNIVLGYYSGAEKIVKAIQGIVNPVTQAVYPHINNLVKASRSEAVRLIKKATTYLGLGTLSISLGTFFFAEPIVELILGNQYLPAATYLKILSPLPLILTLSNIFGIQSLLSFGYQKEFFRVLVFGAAFSLVLIFPLTRSMNGAGSALTLTLTETMITAAMFILMIQKKLFSKDLSHELTKS